MKEKTEHIYILVKVEYDQFRFQENILASTSKDKLYYFYNNFGEDIPIYEYTTKDDIRLSEAELTHYHIQIFPIL